MDGSANSLLCSLQKAKTVKVSGCEITQKGKESFFKFLTGNQQLESLKFGVANSHLTDLQLANEISQPNTSLSLQNCALNEEWLQALSKDRGIIQELTLHSSLSPVTFPLVCCKAH